MKDKVRTWVKRVYGPYTRRDGRQHVILYDGSKRQTVSYPKWIMEQYLGRELEPNETVDHINRDFTDNRIENLQVLSRSAHVKLDVIRVKKVQFSCVWCGENSDRSGRRVSAASKQDKAGPFCSKSCSGAYGAEVQNKRQEKLDPQPEIPIESREYFNNKNV